MYWRTVVNKRPNEWMKEDDYYSDQLRQCLIENDSSQIGKLLFCLDRVLQSYLASLRLMHDLIELESPKIERESHEEN